MNLALLAFTIGMVLWLWGIRTIERAIMATQKEIADQLTALNQALTDIGTGVTKVGTETDTLNQKIADLTAVINAGGDATQEVTDALAAVQASATNLQTLVKAVDDKVPDAPTP